MMFWGQGRCDHQLSTAPAKPEELRGHERRDHHRIAAPFLPATLPQFWGQECRDHQRIFVPGAGARGQDISDHHRGTAPPPAPIQVWVHPGRVHQARHDPDGRIAWPLMSRSPKGHRHASGHFQFRGQATRDHQDASAPTVGGYEGHRPIITDAL